MAEYKSILFEQMIRDFAENEVKPLAQEIDEEERFPRETVEKMAKLGLFGIIIPQQYGGAGAGYREYIYAVEELSKHCGTTGVILSAHTSLCAAPILEHGTEEQKMKYLPDLATGRKRGACGLTEPNAGTDASNQQTVAVEMEDHYLLNGSKIFITNAGEAETYVVIAVTGKGPKGPEMTAFIVEKAFEGFTFGKHEKKMGIRGSATSELIFENVKVPKENMLGKRGEGFKIAMKTLDGGRIGIAAQAGHRRGRSGHHRGLYQEQKAVWQTHFRIPEYPVRPGRYVHQGGRCPGSCVYRRRRQAEQAAHPVGECRASEAVCFRDSHGGYHQGCAAPRRLRLHPRVPR